MRYRQSLIEYSLKHGVTKAAIKYNTNRQYIYRWRNRYDGTMQSLMDISRRPHSHPNQHTSVELKLADMHAGLVVFWVKLKYIPTPYERMYYPGQRAQIDVKHVPTACIVGDASGQKFYSFDDFKTQLAVHNHNYNNFLCAHLNSRVLKRFSPTFCSTVLHIFDNPIFFLGFCSIRRPLVHECACGRM